jgi:hypothetical protein
MPVHHRLVAIRRKKKVGVQGSGETGHPVAVPLRVPAACTRKGCHLGIVMLDATVVISIGSLLLAESIPRDLLTSRTWVDRRLWSTQLQRKSLPRIDLLKK